jgi:Lar family restriction alleviation protein
MKNKLLPCPFCGGTDIQYGYREEDTSSRYMEEIYYLECVCCSAKMEISNNPYSSGKLIEEDAMKRLVEHWNDRKSCDDKIE